MPKVIGSGRHWALRADSPTADRGAMSTAPDPHDTTGSGFFERHRKVTATWALLLLVLLGVLVGTAAGVLLVRLVHMLTDAVPSMT